MIVFADAFFYIALINRRDEYHERAVQFARGFTGTVVTTRWILTEVADALAASPARSRVRIGFQKMTDDAGTRIVESSIELWKRGLDIYDRRPDKSWSLTDCISFAVMEQEGLREALTGDRHFAQAGFTPVFAE